MNKAIYRLGMGLAVLSVCSLPISATIRYSLEDMEKESSRGGFGVVQSNGRSFLKGSIGKDFQMGPLSVGADLNLYYAAAGDGVYPSELQLVTLRSIEYNHNNVAGIKYGRLSDVTYGYGLLMDSYDSGMGGDTTELTLKKGGFKGYLTLMDVRADAMGTFGSLYAGRLSGDLLNMNLFGTPIKWGVTAVSDRDGVNESVNGNQINREAATGYGADLALPLAGDFLTYYVEYARLNNRGNGLSTGFKGDVFDIVKYRMEYQSLESGFVPGYFNTSYEATSFDFATNAPKTAINGFVGNISLALPSTPFKGGIQIESYSDRSLISAAVGWSKVNNTTGVINYIQPFQSASNPILDSTVLYQPGGMVDYIINIKRVYYASNTFTESYNVGFRFNPNKLLPGIF